MFQKCKCLLGIHFNNYYPYYFDKYMIRRYMKIQQIHT